MCDKLAMSGIATLFRAILILGITIAPVYPLGFASIAQTAKMSIDQVVVTDGGSIADPGSFADPVAAMPCHDGKMCCDKDCPCMAACVSLCAQGLPAASDVALIRAIEWTRYGVKGGSQLASLAATPPARPPRA